MIKDPSDSKKIKDLPISKVVPESLQSTYFYAIVKSLAEETFSSNIAIL